MKFVIIFFLLCLVLLIFNIFREKMRFLNLKVKTIEEKINSILIKQKDLLKECEIIIKETLKTNKEIFHNLDFEKLNLIDTDKKLSNTINELFLIKEKYKKLQKNEEFLKLNFAINETIDLLDAYKNYYNDNIIQYNKTINSFPIKIIMIIKRKKKKKLFKIK